MYVLFNLSLTSFYYKAIDIHGKNLKNTESSRHQSISPVLFKDFVLIFWSYYYSITPQSKQANQIQK